MHPSVSHSLDKDDIRSTYRMKAYSHVPAPAFLLLHLVADHLLLNSPISDEFDTK